MINVMGNTSVIAKVREITMVMGLLHEKAGYRGCYSTSSITTILQYHAADSITTRQFSSNHVSYSSHSVNVKELQFQPSLFYKLQITFLNLLTLIGLWKLKLNSELNFKKSRFPQDEWRIATVCAIRRKAEPANSTANLSVRLVQGDYGSLCLVCTVQPWIQTTTNASVIGSLTV